MLSRGILGLNYVVSELVRHGGVDYPVQKGLFVVNIVLNMFS